MGKFNGWAPTNFRTADDRKLKFYRVEEFFFTTDILNYAVITSYLYNSSQNKVQKTKTKTDTSLKQKIVKSLCLFFMKAKI